MHPNDRIQKPFTITLCIYASGSASELKMFMLFLGLSSNLSRYTSYWKTSEFKSFMLDVPLGQPLSSNLLRWLSLWGKLMSSNLSGLYELNLWVQVLHVATHWNNPRNQIFHAIPGIGGWRVLPRHPLSSNLPTLEVPSGQPVSTSFSSCLSYWDILRVHALQADCPIGTTDLEFTFYTLLVPRWRASQVKLTKCKLPKGGENGERKTWRKENKQNSFVQHTIWREKMCQTWYAF